MRISVNLATRPFVELRPFFLRLRLMMAALVLTGAGLALGAHVVSAKAATQGIALDRLRNLTIATEKARLQTEQRLRLPENAAVLDRASFLNTLFLRKSFSWTAVMMDLEDVLPTGVQVTSIEPAVTADGTVTIRLRVAGERDRAVQLVRNLERSRRFLQPRLGSEAAQAKEPNGANGGNGLRAPQSSFGQGGAGSQGGPLPPPGVEFEILAVYNPLPAGETYHVGHGRAQAFGLPEGTVATPVPVSQPAAIAAAAGARNPVPVIPVRPATAQRPTNGNGGENERRGYPRDGVVLPPYGRPPRPQDGRIPPPPSGAGEGGPL